MVACGYFMNVEEFNNTYARHKIKAPLEANIEVLAKEGFEWLLRIGTHTLWAEVRKDPTLVKSKNLGLPIRPKAPRAVSSMSIRDKELSVSEYRVLSYIRSLDGVYIHTEESAREINISGRTFRDALASLNKSGRVITELDKYYTITKLVYVEKDRDSQN